MAEAAAVGPLADRAAVTAGDVTLTVVDRARFRVRCRADETNFGARMAEAGMGLPGVHGAPASDGARVMWLGPDELAVAAAADDGARLTDVLSDAADGGTAVVVDVTDAYATLGLEGAGVAAVLAAGCPLDLDPSVFPPDTCARTVLAKADVVLVRCSETRFEVEVQRSVARYLFDWLARAARANGGGRGL